MKKKSVQGVINMVTKGKRGGQSMVVGVPTLRRKAKYTVPKTPRRSGFGWGG